MLGEIYKTLKEHQGDELSLENDHPIDKEFGIKFGIKFGINEKQLLLALHSNPSLTASDLAEQLGVTQRAIEKQMKKLKDLGVIVRQGSRKNGLWIIKKEEEA